jgi:NAD(P)-dependent dehydrogenase (short-subunit alcohol dehydrogenase family)
MVVTGAAAGSIGAATAQVLRSWGAEVVTTTRSGAGASHALELGDRASVQSFADWVRTTYGEIDVLINNAGIHLDLRSSWKEPRLVDGHEIHWRVNYLGTVQLTEALLPALTGRVVTVVSKLHARGRNVDLLAEPERYHSWEAYGRSKLALMHHTTTLGERRPDLTAVTLHPGEVFTGIATAGLEEHPWLNRARAVLRPLERRVLQTPTEGAQTSLFCATAPDVVPGGYYVRCAPATPSPDALDADVARTLWQQTQEWLVGR